MLQVIALTLAQKGGEKKLPEASLQLAVGELSWDPTNHPHHVSLHGPESKENSIERVMFCMPLLPIRSTVVWTELGTDSVCKSVRSSSKLLLLRSLNPSFPGLVEIA